MIWIYGKHYFDIEYGLINKSTFVCWQNIADTSKIYLNQYVSCNSYLCMSPMYNIFNYNINIKASEEMIFCSRICIYLTSTLNYLFSL